MDIMLKIAVVQGKFSSKSAYDLDQRNWSKPWMG
jgi:hypothetical protein